MGIRARFCVTEVKKVSYNPDALVVGLAAAHRGEENKTWAAATPAAQLSMTISNPAAARWFEDRFGKDVELAFSDVPAPDQAAE